MADVETPTAPTTEGPKDIKDAKESAKEAVEAFNLLAQGKRNMLCNEIPQAVNQLQEACRLLAAKYGETSDQCGEAYLCYGTALLDLSRMESGVLGNALQGIDSEDDESASSDDKVEDPDKVSEKEREEISDKVIDALMEERGAAAEKKEKDEANKESKEKDETNKEAKKNGEAPKENGEAPKENGEAPKENGHSVNGNANGVEKTDQTKDEAMETEETKEKKDDDEKETEEEGEEAEDEGNESESIEDEEGEKTGEEGEKTGEDTEGEAAAAEGEAGTSKKKEEEEDVSNLQLAWEMLELAKIIYARHDSKEMKLKTADAYLKLGEVGLETEQYEQSIGDFKACLKIQKELLEPESRLIAETHYQIGLACCFNQTYEESIEHLNTAVKVINSKVAKLEKVIEEAEKESKDKEVNAFDDPIPPAQKEIKDLKEILPDILAKIEDTRDEMQSQDKVKKLVKENVASEFGTSTGFTSSSTDESISTVDSSLVRKKRKPEDESEDKTPEEKKPRQEEGAGDAAADKKEEVKA